MQTFLKIPFWFSVIFAVIGSHFVGDAFRTYIVAAVFALPGVFIQGRRYQVAAALLVCLTLATAYVAYQRDQAWTARLDTIVKDAAAKKNP